MNAPRINPLLLIDILMDTEEQRTRLEPFLRAIEEDPTSTVTVQQGRIVLAAEDELQLEMACHRLTQSTQAQFGQLRIAYRETIRRVAEGEGKYIRQTGGSGNYGHCWLRIEPNERGKGNTFINEISNGSIRADFLRPVEQGVREAMATGILTGYPMIDMKVTLFDGSSHETDSKDMAFIFAATTAFKDAARKAVPVLLEPVMAIEVAISEEFMGRIIGDINGRRGRIERLDTIDGWSEIEAIVPLAEVLRSSPHGRPEYPMRFAGYQEVPRPNDPGDGDIPVPSIRPRHPRPSRTHSIDPDPRE